MNAPDGESPSRQGQSRFETAIGCAIAVASALAFAAAILGMAMYVAKSIF